MIARDAADVAQGARLRPARTRSRSSSAPAARASTARPRPTASSSTSAATSAASRSRTGAPARGSSPGTVLGHVNRVLAPHGCKLGPDPASTDIACVGGVIANNSGGMRCGVTRDSYSTVRELTFVLASGTVIDTAGRGRRARFAEAEPELAAGLAEIRDEIRRRRRAERADPAQVRDQEHDRLPALRVPRRREPLEIFRRLLVGSEGTLGFIAEAVFETVPQPRRTTALVASLPERRRGARAGRRARRRRSAGGRADGRARADRRRHNIRGTPEYWKELDPFSAALLVEFGGDDEDELAAAEARGRRGARGPRADPRAGLPPRRGDDRGLLAGARGHARAGRQDAGPGDGADRRGRLRAAGADRRDGQGPPGAAHRARLPARGRRPRVGREPALHAHAGLRQAARTSSATTPSWRA